jgi:hypothetical protein
MDNKSLSELLQDRIDRQFWIKPVGDRKATVDEGEVFTTSIINVHFAKEPIGVKLGNILIVFRVGVSKIVYVGEAISLPKEATEEDIQENSWRNRWPWELQAKNLTPEYGANWSKYSLKPFSLEKEYNQQNPEERVNLGGIKRGRDKLRISHNFGEFIVEKIMNLEQESTL